MKTLPLATPPPLSPRTAEAAFSPVLLAIDFGPASLSAARWATTYVARGADAVLAHAMAFTDDFGGRNTPSVARPDSPRRMSPALVGGLGGFAATLDVAAHRCVVRTGPPSRCLAAIAEDTGAALLVLGRRGDANRLRVGEPNVIERTARRARSSALVVPEGVHRAPEHVVAAVDQSWFAARVLEVASMLARMHEVPLTVLHVLPPAAGAYDRVIRSSRLHGSEARDRKAVVRRAASPSIAPDTARWLMQLGRAHNVLGRDATEVATGDPAREIVRTAVERGSSLVVVGMRGADDAPQGSIGSVARELLTRGPIPVLAVNARSYIRGDSERQFARCE